jgi:hypothetical protein
VQANGFSDLVARCKAQDEAAAADAARLAEVQKQVGGRSAGLWTAAGRRAA